MVSYLDNAPNYLSWVRYPKEIICKFKKELHPFCHKCQTKWGNCTKVVLFLELLAEEILSKNHIILFWKPFTLKTFFFFLFHKLRSDVNFRRKNVVRVWLFSTVYLNLFFYKSDFQQHTFRYKKVIYSKSLNKRFGSGFLFIV